MIVSDRPQASGLAAGFLCSAFDPIRAVLFVLIVLTGAALPADDTPQVAIYRDGIITASELESWASHRRMALTNRDEKAAAKDYIEDLVILKVLVGRYDALGLEQSSSHRARLDYQRWEMAERRLRAQVAEASLPSDADLKAAFDAEPGRYSRPRQWQLENIFKRWPVPSTQAARETMRRQMCDLRRRILEGEDFATLARLESQSQTRLRGGRLGLASLDELQSEVALEVAKMEAGTLSPVIETRDGLTLLRCSRVFEAKDPSLAEVRDRISKELRRLRYKEAWQALDRRLIEEFKPSYRTDTITAGAPETAVVATLQKNGASKGITLAEYRVFLGRERVHQVAHTLGRERNLQFLRARILLEAHALEATRRRLDTGPSYGSRLAWKQLELKARMALDEAVSELITYPTDEEVKVLYTRRLDDLIEEETLHLRALELPVDRTLPRELYDEFEDLVERLDKGEIDMEAAAHDLEPHATVVDLGWKTPDAVWLLGRNVGDAVKRLEPGGFSRPVQEGRILRIFQLVARRKPRTPSLSEARPRLEASLIAARRLKAEETIRRTILSEPKIEVMP